MIFNSNLLTKCKVYYYECVKKYSLGQLSTRETRERIVKWSKKVKMKLLVQPMKGRWFSFILFDLFDFRHMLRTLE